VGIIRRINAGAKSQAGTGLYYVSKLINLGDPDSLTLYYARVSSHDQKVGLERQ